MSFSKSKRFSYSPPLPDKHKMNKEKRCGYNNSTSQLSKNPTKYTIYFPPDSMPVSSPIRNVPIKRKIDTKPFCKTIFNESEYFVDEHGNISNPEEETSTPVTFMDFQRDLRDLDEKCKNIKRHVKQENLDSSKIYNKTKNTFNCKNVEMPIIPENKEKFPTFEEFQRELKRIGHIYKINSNDIKLTNNMAEIERTVNGVEEKMKTWIENGVCTIKGETGKKFQEFIKSINEIHDSVTAAIKKQCQDELKNLMHVIKSVISRNQITAEEDLRRLISLLMQQVEEGKFYTEFLDSNYCNLLTAADKKIEEQSVIIDALKAEIDAGDLATQFKNILRK